METFYSVANIAKCLPKDDLQCVLSIWIFRIVQPMLVSIGTVGNILNILVLTRKAFRSKPILILIPLAVSDLMFLWASTIVLHEWHISQSNDGLGEIFKKAVDQILGLARGCSNWVIALFSVVRVISILFPLTANTCMSIKRTFLALTVLVIVFGITTGFFAYGFQHFNPYRSHESFANTTGNITGCYMVSKDFGEYCPVIRIIYLLSFVLVPIAVSCIGNIALIIKLKCFRRPVSSRSQDSQTSILFAITGYLFATSVIVGAGVIIKERRGYLQKNNLVLMGVLMYLVQLSNYAVNFFLYLWKGTMFKKEFKQMIQDIKVFYGRNGNIVFKNV